MCLSNGAAVILTTAHQLKAAACLPDGDLSCGGCISLSGGVTCGAPEKYSIMIIHSNKTTEVSYS